MPPSNPDAPIPGTGLAIVAQALYLLNLLALPGLPFLVLLWLYLRKRGNGPELGVGHLRETIRATLWALCFLIGANLLILYLGGYTSPYSWVVVGLYFICVHSMFVLFGMFGLARAMASKPFLFPLNTGIQQKVDWL